jgi:hypothetical protein
MSELPRVYMLDDSPFIRALAPLIPDCEVTAYGSWPRLVEVLVAPLPAAVVLDISLGEFEPDTFEALAAGWLPPGIPCVFISGHGTIPLAAAAAKIAEGKGHPSRHLRKSPNLAADVGVMLRELLRDPVPCQCPCGCKEPTVSTNPVQCRECDIDCCLAEGER